MKRIIIHWTAGANKPNTHEKECYHYLVDTEAVVHKGKYTPEDNLDCTDGKYAQHTGGGNTGSVGVALCGMFTPQHDRNVRNTKYPITKIEFEKAMLLVAQLCEKYKLPITEKTVLTHYEFGRAHPNTKSADKIDITYLPCYPKLQAGEIGRFIRSKVSWYKANINNYENILDKLSKKC